MATRGSDLKRRSLNRKEERAKAENGMDVEQGVVM
jgi:hypothetical protein